MPCKKHTRRILWIAAALAVAGIAAVGIVGIVKGWWTGWQTQQAGLHVEVSRQEYPVKGIDISHHNGVIDFKKVAADSVDFVIIKATEGVNWQDPLLMANYRGATAAGLHVGFYHFFKFNRGGVKQGRYFLQTVRDIENATPADTTVSLPLIIDVESAFNQPTDYYLVIGRLRDMIGYLKRHGRRVMLYGNGNDYERYLKGNFDGVDLWLASSRAPEAPGDNSRLLWQHSHNGRVRGIDAGAVDVNTFNGSRADFERWLNAN